MKKLILSIALLAAPSFAADQSSIIEECKIPMPDNLSEGNAAVAQMRDVCLPKIKRVAECVSRTRLLSDSVVDFVGKFRKPSDPKVPLLVVASADIEHFDIKNSDINVWRNFQSLEAQYVESLEAVRTLARKYKNIDTAALASAMRAQLDALDYDYSQTSKALARLSENEYKLMIFIDNIKRDVQESYKITMDEALWLTSDACKDADVLANTSATVKQIQGAIVVFSEDIDAIYEHMLSAKIARQNLINYTYTVIRSEIEDAYSARLGDELSTMGGKIDTILRANRLSARFENWYNWSSFEPERDKMLSTYLQFEGARRILAADLVSAQNFREQMIVVTEAYPETGEFYLNRMDSVIKNLKTQLDRLEAKGWQGYLASQKAVATRLVGTTSVPADCKARYQGFLDRSGAVDNLETYRLSERVYMNAVIGCARK